MNLLFILIADSDVHIDSLRITQILLHSLFDIPTMDDRRVIRPPKCKSQRARQSAFRLLGVLCKNSDAAFTMTSEKIWSQHDQG